MPSAARPHGVRRGATARAAAAALVLLTGAGVLAAPAAAAAPLPPPPADRALTAPVVVAGIGGLGWDDVSPERTPTLWALLEDGASAAAVTVHTTGQPACPDGGWLSLSAGRPVGSERFAGWCKDLPEVVPGDEGGRVSGWLSRFVDELDSPFQAEIGTLGPTLALADGCATAVGPGAALALARPDGWVARYRATVTPDAFDCAVTVVDLGVTSVLEDAGGGPLAADRALGELLDDVPAGTDLLVTSVSAPLGERLQLGITVLAAAQSSAAPSDEPGVLLSSASTRRDGVVRLLDLPSTLVELAGVAEPAALQGSPLVRTSDELDPDDPAATARDLADVTVADRGLRAATNPLLDTAGTVALLLVAGALLWGRRRVPPGARRGLEGALLLLAALPVAAYLVTLVRWWRLPDPGLGLWLGMIAIAALLAAAALVGRDGRAVWRPALALSAVTTAVLLVDGVTGTHLHWASPLGTSAVFGNRYYGFGNSTYAVLAVHALVLAGVLAARYVAAARRRAAVLAVAVVGVATVVVDVWPTWGADVGGGFALVPAFGLLALAVSGARTTVARVVAALAAGVAVVAGVALLDWSREPSQRSHAGRFVQLVVDGDAWDLLMRKLDYAIDSLGRGPVAWLTVLVLVWLALALARPAGFAPPSLRAAVERWPELRPTLAAVLTSAVVGSLINDWGIRVATVELTVALPLVAVVCLRATDQPRPQRRASARSDPRSPTAASATKTAAATAAAASAPPTATASDASAKR